MVEIFRETVKEVERVLKKVEEKREKLFKGELRELKG